MANNVLNQGLAPQFVAAETLRTLVPVLAPLNKIVTTDFSAYVAEKGQVVHTRFANKFTASTYVRANGFVPADANATDVAITLDSHKYVAAAFNDTEVATISLDMLRRVPVRRRPRSDHRRQLRWHRLHRNEGQLQPRGYRWRRYRDDQGQPSPD